VDLVEKMIKIDRCFAFEGLANKNNSSLKKSNKRYNNNNNNKSVTFQQTITTTSQTHLSLYCHHSLFSFVHSKLIILTDMCNAQTKQGIYKTAYDVTLTSNKCIRTL